MMIWLLGLLVGWLIGDIINKLAGRNWNKLGFIVYPLLIGLLWLFSFPK